MIAAVCVVVVAALAGVTVALLDRSNGDDRRAQDSTTTTPFGSGPADGVTDSAARSEVSPPSTTTTTTLPPTTLPPTTLDPVAAANQALEETKAADRGRVEALTGAWVPQISSKRVGLRADGIVYDAPAILAKHRQLTTNFSYDGVGLLWSGDYSTFKEGSYWVSIALTGYATPDGANIWCDQAGLGPDDCFAKLLSHTASSSGSTKSRSAR